MMMKGGGGSVWELVIWKRGSDRSEGKEDERGWESDFKFHTITKHEHHICLGT